MIYTIYYVLSQFSAHSLIARLVNFVSRNAHILGAYNAFVKYSSLIWAGTRYRCTLSICLQTKYHQVTREWLRLVPQNERISNYEVCLVCVNIVDYYSYYRYKLAISPLLVGANEPPFHSRSLLISSDVPHITCTLFSTALSREILSLLHYLGQELGSRDTR